MSGETSTRSNLIDITYQKLHEWLSSPGQPEDATLDQIPDFLEPRVDRLKNISHPFGKPSDASKKKIESGSVQLRDGVTIRLEDSDKGFVMAISKRFDIDEIEALVLLRSFLYNEGLPDSFANAASVDEELADAITPFYYSERLYVLRLLPPLLRAYTNPEEAFAELAANLLPKVMPDPTKFADELLVVYRQKTKARPPANLDAEPKKAGLWAKQNAKEQLILLEVLFWTRLVYECEGPLVATIFEVAYETKLGTVQQNSTLLLDDECVRLQQDSAALWILITIEVLELERLAFPGELEITEDPHGDKFYWNSPDSLQRIHKVVTENADSQYACQFIAWAFVLSRLVQASAKVKDIPPTSSYKKFFETIVPPLDRAYAKGRDPAHILMSQAALSPEAGLFPLMLTLLTNSPLFVTSVAWRTGSTVTDPNAVAFRSVFKGLVIAIVELVPVEMIPDFDGLLEVWIALFGRSETDSVVSICEQFWSGDWPTGIARRAIVDVARSRFPVQSKALVRLLRALSGYGFLDTDPLSTSNYGGEVEAARAQRLECANYIFHYLNEVSTYTQVIPIAACSGSHTLYEKLPERMISATVSTGVTYTNLRPIKLPGGSTLPARSIGRLLNSDGGDFIAVSWQHKHSGWKLLLEILTDYVNRRRVAGGPSHHDVSFGRKAVTVAQSLTLEEIGIDIGPGGDDVLITDVLDLIRSVVQNQPEIAEQVLESFESGDPVVAHSALESQPPDLVQLTTMILEDSLSRSSAQHRAPPSTELITSAMSVLAALLALPKYSNRVWLYIRSTSALFGSERAVGFTSAVIASERLTGNYTMTLALLNLVHHLFDEASSTVINVVQESPRLQQVKEEVLMRAARFVHSEIWVEHVGWKYAQLGDRFEIGRRVSSFYYDVLKHSSPTLKEQPFSSLSQAVFEALVSRATTSALSPLITSLTTSNAVLAMLYSTRRYGEMRRLIYMLESYLILLRTVLHAKQKVMPSQQCLLEQALCTRSSGKFNSADAAVTRLDPIEALSAFAKERRLGANIPVYSMEVLFALCSSLSTATDSSPSIIGYLSDPESTVASLVRIISHPYDDALLRNAVWNFITLAVDKEPALAGLFVRGQYRSPSVKGKEKETNEANSSKATSALSVAQKMLDSWEEYWEVNPQLLASVVRFLDVVWEHGHEHASSLDALRKDSTVFASLAGIVQMELGPLPDYKMEKFVAADGVQRSEYHEAVSGYSYRAVIKSHALHILALDIRMSLPSKKDPASYTAIQGMFSDEDQITELVMEASSRAYDPRLYDEMFEQTQQQFSSLKLDQLQIQEPVVERTFGDEFAYSTSLLKFRLQTFADGLPEQVDDAVKMLTSINLNLSLAHSQTTLTESWQHFLLQIVPYIRKEPAVRPIALALASNISHDIAIETRSGDLMSTIHYARLSLLLSLVEVAWFSGTDKKEEVEHFIALVKNLRGIILNESQPPAKSFLGQVAVQFHRPLLQIAYFCARHSRSLIQRPKVLNADQRLDINATLDVVLELVISALSLTFDSARLRQDVELDQNMEILVAVFEQCTNLSLNPSTSRWLSKCQESDVIRASLQLFTQVDLSGYSDIPLLRVRKQPLYAPHVLTFHLALASIPAAAERLASEGVLIAYTENTIAGAIKAGQIDVVLPELPGERSPVHKAYCNMLAVVSGVSLALGQHGHYFATETCGLAQLYSDQIHRALSWTIGDALTTPLLEEIEQSVNLFYAISASPKAAAGDPAIRRALDFFAADALLLLQQFNYALTHHNHLASLFEPVTVDERTQYEADSANAGSVSASSDMIDLVRRPFVTKLVHRLFTISASILSTLVNISKAEAVLLDEPETWPIHQALVVPHSKVVLGETASLGTLFELGNCSLDVIKYLVGRPATQSLVPAHGIEKPLDVRDSIRATRRNLEAVLFYATTQFAMWLAKPSLDDSTHDMEAEEAGVAADGTPDKERRGSRKSSMIPERLRRGMTGEMAADLLALLTRAKPLIAKTQATFDGKAVDLTQVLAVFVQERIVLA